ncbi:hypothetical protein [Cohnella silvisoli]|uniref:Peptidylprolyl isomerase n=1 Tax=Cohnella silvisoli TaxID=2873699 RepID=A0ABV1L3H1_9BACL|nr:hypothetical protein [Cohnella silvisoli]MCD9026108.1 hypothetical protein [Cohnella silvisoli]
MNRKRRIGMMLLIVMTFTSGCTVKAENERSSDRTNVLEIVASVNGEPIRYGEFAMIMERKRSEAVRYFYDKYGAEDIAEYWTTAFGKETPIEWLKSAALDETARIKVQQIIARDEGVVKRIDYSDFRNDWIQENELRHKAEEKKELIYGPLQYDENVYYEYVFSNTVLQVKEKLRKRSNTSVGEGERLYQELLERKLSSATDVIQRDVYDRIQNP